VAVGKELDVILSQTSPGIPWPLPSPGDMSVVVQPAGGKLASSKLSFNWALTETILVSKNISRSSFLFMSICFEIKVNKIELKYKSQEKKKRRPCYLNLLLRILKQ
jgi:hypothetical protein